MGISRRQALALAAGAGAAAGFGRGASAQAPTTIKFSHVVAPDTPKGRGADKFKELAERYANGAVRVEVYPNSQLYKDKEELEALQLGAVQMLAPSVSKFGPLGVREFEVFDLPFLARDTEGLHRMTEGPSGRALLAKLDGKGIAVLAYWDNGFKIMSANRLLRTPDDFRGLKMRIQSSKVLEAQMRALGALPQVMAFSEVYQALQTGVVDGQENPPSNMYTQRMHEVQSHATLSNHGFVEYAVIANKRFWDGLAAPVRTALTRAMQESTAYVNEICQRENDDAVAEMRKSGKIQFLELSADQLDLWKKAMRPVYSQMESRVGRELIQTMLSETHGGVA